MRMELKEEFTTNASVTDDGYLVISQEEMTVTLSGGQVKTLLKWLEDGNGLSLESSWNNGADMVED